MRVCACPSCGAELSILNTNREFAFCEYCGAKIMLDDLRITEKIIDVAQLKRIEFDQQSRDIAAQQQQRSDIYSQWDAEQKNDELEIEKAKSQLHTCILLCFVVIGFYALPFFAVKYSNLKKEFAQKKARRNLMRSLPLERFFQEMEHEWQLQSQNEQIRQLQEQKRKKALIIGIMIFIAICLLGSLSNK